MNGCIWGFENLIRAPLIKALREISLNDLANDINEHMETTINYVLTKRGWSMRIASNLDKGCIDARQLAKIKVEVKIDEEKKLIYLS